MVNIASASVGTNTGTRDRIIFFLPLVLTGAFLCLKLVRPKTYMAIIQEDQIVESLQVAFYLVAGILAFITAYRSLRSAVTTTRIIYLGFAIGLLLMSLEEISWGQRLLYLPSPRFFLEYNRQHEINLHNLRPVQPLLHSIYILVACYAAFAWRIVPRRVARRYGRSNILPPRILMLYFLPVAVFYLYIELGTYVFAAFIPFDKYTFGNFICIHDQEPAELLFSLGLLLFTLINIVKHPVLSEVDTPEGNDRKRSAHRISRVTLSHR